MNALNTVLVATDGSEPGEVAIDLAMAMHLPAEASMEIVDVNEPIVPDPETPPGVYTALDRDIRAVIEEYLAKTRSRVAGQGLRVETAMPRGRAANEIVHEAERLGTDLIVIGSRGRGPIATMLLGSVAAEVVDRAPCPVLVARVPRLKRIVVADDGSAAAARAVQLVASWPTFRALPALVVSVAPVYAFTGNGPIRHEDAKQRYAEHVDALRGIHGRIADAAAGTLEHAGLSAETQTRFGDPAKELIDGALEYEADLIVMGSRGQTGLERLVLGSVARNVLTHAPMSVLIVHGARSR